MRSLHPLLLYSHGTVYWCCTNYFFAIAMAGNIVPAIASTNAVVGGVIVMEALNVISSNIDKCKSVSNNMMSL